MEQRRSWFVALLLSLLLATGCSKVEDAADEGNGSEGADGGSGNGNGDGDGDGDSAGDGDGDGASGDGDGDAAGDGDGDASGDGDNGGDEPAGEIIDAGMYADVDGSIPCGATYCAPEGCCADPFVSICGAAIGERGCILPPPRDASSDERCPEFSAMGIFTLPSCCTDDNMCGINVEQFGSGCVENSRFAMAVIEMAGGGVSEENLPMSQPCE